MRNELEKQGNWLFSRRSYLPFIILPIFFIALTESEILGRMGAIDLLWESSCLLLSFVGLAIRCLTIGYVGKGTSGRNTKEQKAEAINTAGMYSIVRHPLYLGNFIIFLGVILFTEVWWFVLIAVQAFFLYYERIMFAEEEFLRNKYGAIYMEWAAKTPFFMPKLGNWQKPLMSFSFKNILKREYTAFFVITVFFPVIDILADLVVEKKWELKIGWCLLFTIGLITYLILRTLKKLRTLDVEGR